MRRIADAHRARILVAGEVRDLPLGQPPLARDAVHHADLFRPSGDHARQPVAPVLRLVVVAGIHQREQRQRRVAHPAVAVIPVALAADEFGQRGRRRRHDPAGRLVGQRLERDQRARDRLGPRPVDVPPLRPCLPVRLGVLQRRIGGEFLGHGKVRRAVAQHERHAIAFADNKFADRREVLAAQMHRRAQHHHVGTRDGAQRSGAGELAHPRHDLAVAKAQHQLHAHCDAAAFADDDAHAIRIAALHRHEVDQRDGAVAGSRMWFRGSACRADSGA